jgi:hypothetical protein
MHVKDISEKEDDIHIGRKKNPSKEPNITLKLSNALIAGA